MNRRVAVRGIVPFEGKMLAVRLNKYKGGILSGTGSYWCTPGGGVDANEPLLDALHREMIEETGITPVIGNLLYVQQFMLGDLENLEFFFHITNGADYLSVDLSKTTHGMHEIAEIAFINNTTADILPSFLMHENIAAITPHTATKIFNNIS